MKPASPSASSPLPVGLTLYEDAPCGLAVTAPDGTFCVVNRVLCRWLGREATDLVACTRLQDLLTAGGRIFHQTHWAPLLRLQGAVHEVKLELIHREGHNVPMMLNAVVRERDGATYHEVAFFVLTDRHRYEQELLLARRRAEDALAQKEAAQLALAAALAQLDQERQAAEDRARFAEQMVGIVGHDLRSPLSTIRMSTDLLARGELSDAQRQVLGRLHSSTARASRMTSDLVDFTRARMGQGLSAARAPADLHAVVAQAVDAQRPTAPGWDLRHHAVGPGDCRIDSDRVARLVTNLVANAIAYGDPAQGVDITSAVTAAEFSVAVRNGGAPIDAARLPTLFRPQTRHGPSGATRRVTLGLFMVQEIARAHGGDVTVVSTPEAGTVFKATAPRE